MVAVYTGVLRQCLLGSLNSLSLLKGKWEPLQAYSKRVAITDFLEDLSNQCLLVFGKVPIERTEVVFVVQRAKNGT